MPWWWLIVLAVGVGLCACEACHHREQLGWRMIVGILLEAAALAIALAYLLT